MDSVPKRKSEINSEKAASPTVEETLCPPETRPNEPTRVVELDCVKRAIRTIRYEFTERQRTILRWVAADATNPEISEHTEIGIKTVEAELTTIFSLLGVRGRLSAAVLYVAVLCATNTLLKNPDTSNSGESG